MPWFKIRSQSTIHQTYLLYAKHLCANLIKYQNHYWHFCFLTLFYRKPGITLWKAIHDTAVCSATCEYRLPSIGKCAFLSQQTRCLLKLINCSQFESLPGNRLHSLFIPVIRQAHEGCYLFISGRELDTHTPHPPPTCRTALPFRASSLAVTLSLRASTLSHHTFVLFLACVPSSTPWHS